MLRYNPGYAGYAYVYESIKPDNKGNGEGD